MTLDESLQPGTDEEFAVGALPFVVASSLKPYLQGAVVDFWQTTSGPRFQVDIPRDEDWRRRLRIWLDLKRKLTLELEREVFTPAREWPPR